MIQNHQNPEFGTRTIASSWDQWIHNGDYIRFIKFYVVYCEKLTNSRHETLENFKFMESKHQKMQVKGFGYTSKNEVKEVN